MFIWIGSTGSTSLFLRGGLLIILIICIFLSPFLVLQDAYVNSVFSCTARILNSLPIEYFPLTYGLNGFKSRISRHLLTLDSFETDFLHAWIFLCIFFLVTPSFVVAVQACIEWIPIFLFKKRNFVGVTHQVKIHHHGNISFTRWG